MLQVSAFADNKLYYHTAANTEEAVRIIIHFINVICGCLTH